MGPPSRSRTSNSPYSATEGKALNVGVVFAASDGVAQSRNRVAVRLLTDDSGAADAGQDCTDVSSDIPVAPAGWSAPQGDGYTYTAPQDVHALSRQLYGA